MVASGSSKVRTAAALAAFAALAAPGAAGAREDSGVAPTRLSLPKGPGSLGGIGENAQPMAQMGLLGYGIDIAVPAGYPGLTPQLRLAYSSGNGNGIAGMGWDVATPSIERMTSQGVPRYTAADRFAADGSTELARVATNGTSATYRARFEGGFVRYTWIDRLASGAAGTGADGYWKAEYPDGTVGTFGARADGTPVDTAVVRGTRGTFRYLLTERVDPAGRHILYGYQRDGARLLLRRVSYVFSGTGAEATPRYEVVLGYEDRPDVLSDGRPGFNLRTTKRLSTIDVTARGEALRGYRLAYEPVSLSGGLSRLSSVTTLGRHGEVAPVRFAFQYSASLPAGCAAGSACGATVTTVPEALGVDPRDGSLELVDLDGDALPDVLSTRGGAHTFWFNRPAASGATHFSAPTYSQVGHGDLGGGRAELLDVNGDGFTDLLDAATGTVLFNRGASDWLVNQQFQLSGLPDLAGANLRFLDYNDDKRIDLVQSSADSTTFWENLGNGQFALAPGGTALGTGFDDGAASLADLNGDGLLDVVRVVGGNVQVRLDLGLGSFGAWQAAGSITEQYPGEARFADLNGDGLADAVIVRAGTVRVALNKNGQGFDAPRVWTSSATLPFPAGTDDNLVRFADMDGNGSTDLVWIDASGKVTYLDLFATRPNLLTRISNGIGQVIVAEYGNSSEHARRDGATTPPAYRLPGVFATLDRLSRTDTLSGVRKVETFHYQDGYYDGREKQFRGFTTVVVATDAGASVEPGLVTTRYDVGVDEPARRGLALDEATTSAGRAIDATSTSYVACPIAGVDAQVRFICPDRRVRTIQEGAAPGAEVRTEEDYAYDRYGHRVRTLELGVVGQSGDERLEELTYVSPETNGGRWRLDLRATRRESFAEDGASARVETYHYDGDAFVGLPAGQATNGWLTRTETTTDDAGTTIDALRQRLDASGAVVEALDANGHRRRFGYDDDGLLVREETVVLDDPGHPAYGLRASVVYDPVQDLVIESHPWVRTDRPEAAPGADDARRTLYAWDGLGRLTAIARPGDTLALPSEDFAYDLGDPVSRIVHHRRSVAGAPSPDLEDVQCFDGLGRAIETRTRVDANRFQVSGFAALNGLDQPRFQTLPYSGEGDACDRLAPAGTRARRLRYDARGRLLETVQPDASIFGSASRVVVSHAPLATTTLDEEASATGAHAGAARVIRQDGLGRVVAVERGLAATATAPAATLVTRFAYDAHGQLARREDPMGHVATHHFDALGHLVGIDDPDAGTIRFRLDALGNPLARTDARGRTVESRYDETGRLLARWDDAAPDVSRVDFEYDVDQCVAGVCGRGDGELGRIGYPLGDGRRGEDRLVRDARGRAIWSARRLGDRELALGSEYDDADRTTARVYPGGRRVAFALDGAGRVAAIPGILDAVDYSAAGALAAITRPGGFVTRYGYDALDRLATVDTRAATVLQAYRFTRDRAGNLVHVDDATPRAEGAPSLAADYELDSLYRLTEARLDSGRAAEETLDFSYDADDDPLARTSSRGVASPEHLGSFVYGGAVGPHAVTAAGGLALGYDAAGHMTRRGDVELVWDDDEHLAAVRRGPETLARFAYDAFGKRVEKWEAGHVTSYLAPDYELHDGTDAILVALAGRQVARLESRRQHVAGAEDLDGDGRIGASDAWLALALAAGIVQRDVDASHADLERILAASARALLAGDGDAVETLTYPLTDAVGTVVGTADAHGAVLERTWRYPFGGERARSTDIDEERGFVGSELDRSSGLAYFGARYLDVRLGRWAAVDPLVVGRLDLCRDQPGECNLYGYAQENPLARVDPTGTHSSKDLGPFAMPVHQMAVQRVLGGRVDHFAVQAMCDAQRHIDMFQHNEDQHLHALVGDGVKRDVAIARSNQVVRDKIEEAISLYQQGQEYDAWEALGWAIHVLQDSTSPKHEGFQGWNDKAGWRAEVRHGWGERYYPNGLGQRKLEGATLYVYDLFKQGMTEPDRKYLDDTTFFEAGSGKLRLPEKYLAPVTPGKEQSE